MSEDNQSGDGNTTLELLAAYRDSVGRLLDARKIRVDAAQTTELENAFNALRVSVAAGEQSLAELQRSLAEKEGEVTRLRSVTKSRLDAALDRIAAGTGPDSNALPDLVWLGIMGIVSGLGYLAYLSGSCNLGVAAVALTDVAMFSILLIAALRSNTSYRWLAALAPKFRNVLPSRVFAIALVILFIAATALGFAGIYAGVSPALFTHHEALYHSVVTLAGLGFNDTNLLTDSLQVVMMWELVSSVLLVICILALLINRLSEF